MRKKQRFYKINVNKLIKEVTQLDDDKLLLCVAFLPNIVMGILADYRQFTSHVVQVMKRNRKLVKDIRKWQDIAERKVVKIKPEYVKSK